MDYTAETIWDSTTFMSGAPMTACQKSYLVKSTVPYVRSASYLLGCRLAT